MANYCMICSEECEVVEETFDFAGTHCTHGRSGTHHTGQWVSDCCLAHTTDDPQDLVPAGWHLEHNPKPIPIRDHDWDFWHEEYDGAIDGNGLCGTGSSPRDCIEQILDIPDPYEDGDDWDAERRENAELEGDDPGDYL